MSYASLRHRFKEEQRKSITFEKMVEIFHNVEGSVAAHRTEPDELKARGVDKTQIEHLQEHIREGEELLREIRGMHIQH